MNYGSVLLFVTNNECMELYVIGKKIKILYFILCNSTAMKTMFHVYYIDDIVYAFTYDMKRWKIEHNPINKYGIVIYRLHLPHMCFFLSIFIWKSDLLLYFTFL